MLGGKLIQYQSRLKWYTFTISFTMVIANKENGSACINLCPEEAIQYG